MQERKQQIKGSGLKRIAPPMGRNGQINFGQECVDGQNFPQVYGPFTIPANPAVLSETPDWLPVFNSEKTTEEHKQ